MKELSEKEKEIIREVKTKYKLGARRLEKVIEQVYGRFMAFTSLTIATRRRFSERRTEEKEREGVVHKADNNKGEESSNERKGREAL